MGRGAGSGAFLLPEVEAVRLPPELLRFDVERELFPRLDVFFFCVEEANGIILSKRRQAADLSIKIHYKYTPYSLKFQDLGRKKAVPEGTAFSISFSCCPLFLSHFISRPAAREITPAPQQ